jgi:hypothetical protein
MPSLVKTRSRSGRESFLSQAFDAEPGENQAVTSFLSQAFDAEPGEDQVSYRAVTSFLYLN